MENAKANEPSTCLQAFLVLFQSDDAAAQLNGLALLRHVAANTWHRLSAQEQQSVVQQMQHALQNANFSTMAQPVRTQFAYAFSDVMMAAGQQAIEHTVSTLLVSLIQRGAHVWAAAQQTAR